jgi:hypothetical protein
MSNRKDVGRGRPPRSKRFGRGQKRSPGRPRGALGEKTIMQNIANELHDLEQQGVRRRVTTFELLLIRMRGLAMEGDLRASKWLTEYSKSKNIVPDRIYGLLVVPETLTPEEWNAQAERHNALHQENPEDRDDPLLRSMFDEQGRRQSRS